MKTKAKLILSAAIACGMLPTNVPLLAPQAAHATFRTCINSNVQLDNEIRSSQPPSSASSIVHLTNAMWAVKKMLDWADVHCVNETDYDEARSDYQAQYDQAETGCRQLASSQSYCVPTRYVRSY